MNLFRTFLHTPWLLALAPILALSLACSGGGSGSTAGGGMTPDPAPQLKISTQAEGLVKVTYADLQAAGFTQSPLTVKTLKLTHQGQPVALNVSSANGQTLAAGDSFQFYAQAIDTVYTGTNVYWLSTEGTTQSAMATRAGSVSGTPTPLQSFQDTLHVEQNKLIWGATPGAPEADYWFWQSLTAPTVQAFSFQLAGLSEANGASSLKLCLYGRTSSGVVSPDHHVVVSFNGTQVANLTWTGLTENIQTISLPSGLLNTGTNSLTLSLPGDTGAAVDSVLLNYFEIQSWRPLQATGGRLTFTVPGNSPAIQVAGFPGSDTLLLDVTDPMHAAFVTPSTGADGSGTFHVLFQDASTTARTYLACSPSLVQAPSSLETWQPGLLKHAANAADYILITPRAFLQAVQPLCDLRKSQGLRVKAVAVEDIYNEFGYGFPVPDAIKSFLGYASLNWSKPAPTYVLFLGDATYDFRNWRGSGKVSQVPCHFSSTSLLGLTPDDNWYVALNGNNEIPSMQLGRLPSASADQAALLVQKILQYEGATTAVPSTALLVADNNVATFQADCDTLAGLLPSRFTPQKIYLSQYTNFTQCTLDIVSAINNGAVLTTYNGHGDVLDWAGEQVFKPGTITQLNNGNQLTCMLMLNCENAFFALPTGYGLAEAVVGAQGRGAIAAFGSTGINYEWENSLVGMQFFNLFFAGNNLTIGAVCSQAKVGAYQQGASVDLLRTFTLIGDPATRIRLPK